MRATDQRLPHVPTEPSASIAWWLAWTAHIYTGLGALAGLLAALAVIEDRHRAAFLWMAVSVVIDATDGWWARFTRVKDVLPLIDGALLDNLVDYVTYVFVPALFVVSAGLVPASGGIAVAAVILLASGLGFSRADAKSPDHFFTGFPSYWNIVVFYLFAARLPPAVNAAVLLALAALVFVPVGYIYPSRTPTLQRVTVALGVAWGLLVLAMIWRLPDVPRGWLAVSLAFPVYYAVLSVTLHLRRGSDRGRIGVRSGSDP